MDYKDYIRESTGAKFYHLNNTIFDNKKETLQEFKDRLEAIIYKTDIIISEIEKESNYFAKEDLDNILKTVFEDKQNI